MLTKPNIGDAAKNPQLLTQLLDQFFDDVVVQVNTASPPGLLTVYASSIIPSGWLECDNAEYNQTKYPNLFKRIGQTYGGASGTFNVPAAADLPTLPHADTRWIIRAD